MAFLNVRALAFTSSLAVALCAASASAHISLDRGTTHKSRYGDALQKDAPCGQAGGTRSQNVYTHAAGETITVELREFIPHPSYYRIAFDADGDDDFKDPASLTPIDPTRPCPFNAADKCGTSDFYNDPSVLPNMDNLEPHLASASKGTYSFQVTLPDVECDNCTLQIIQVMEDVIHGAYNPTPGDPADNPYIADVYHQCIDLVLTRQSTGGAGGTAGAGGSASPQSSEDDGGCALGGQPGSGAASWMLLGLGLSGLARLRRRR
jgi:hypothetical protein